MSEPIEVVELNYVAWLAERDAIVRQFLDVSADEFIAKFNSGDYDKIEIDGLTSVLAYFPELDESEPELENRKPVFDTPMSNRQVIDVKEFREKGYLQEVNRRFLHPLGLALAVNISDDGIWTLDSIWDSRDDPEGFVFGDIAELEPMALLIDEEMTTRLPLREKALGYWIQPTTTSPASEQEK